MTETSTIVVKGKVANIVADSQIAINVGSADGVRKGDTVTLRRKVDVIDPDSQKVLGSVFYTRLSLEVNYVEKAFCVARVTDRVATTPLANAIAGLGQVAKLKGVTLDAAEESSGTVLIHIGEEAVVRRTKPQDED